jgi:redox-sensitive bicupin YhaK (pirin superfamily)
MIPNRKLISVQTPPPHPGFLGAGHTARAVIQNNFSMTDPFILLMDDQLDKKGNEPVGGPHPHAGFETVTLVLEGELGNGSHAMKEGDFQMMTAGSGIVHTETIEKEMRMRILQLWLTLPRKDRWTTPRVQDLALTDVPRVRLNGSEIRVYSGSLAGVTAPILNYVPMIIADIHLQPGATLALDIPGGFNTFLYVTKGRVEIGEEKKPLQEQQVGWLDTFPNDASTTLSVVAGASGSRFALYSGQPQREGIVSYGPFIGDKQQDIIRLYEEYRQGRMQHVSELEEAQSK